MGLAEYLQRTEDKKFILNKKDIIKFFDHRANQWDLDLERDEEVIGWILDNAGVKAGLSVLDVACGTGVLIPDYLARDVSTITCVDISSKMVAIAREKFSQANIHFLCGDVETITFPIQFDCIVIYNSFPHFSDPVHLINKLTTDLKPGGSLTVAHGMSRAKINQHHESGASTVSIPLLHEDELEKIFKSNLKVTNKISNDRMYQVTGVKRKMSQEK